MLASGALAAWSDHFTEFSGSQFPDYVYNGRWGDCIYRWGNTRTLSGNSDDQFWVTDGFNNGAGSIGSAINAHGGYGSAPYLHAQSGSTLRLRTYALTQAEADTFLYGYRYPSGAISESVPPLLTSGNAYGTWEIRFRFNSLTQGQTIAIWLLSDDGIWPPEIDILECVNTTVTWYASTHFVDGGELTSYNRPGAADSWYVFKMTISPTLLTWRVNDVIVREENNTLPAYRWYINITNEVGTAWSGSPDGTTVWPSDFEIDYVTFSNIT
jgi:hypothetical protein